MAGLFEVLKGAALDTGFLDAFETSASRVALPKATLGQRLLLCLYGFGTNAGLKRVARATAELAMKSFCMCIAASFMRGHCGRHVPVSPMPRLQFAMQRFGVMRELLVLRIPKNTVHGTAT